MYLHVVVLELAGALDSASVRLVLELDEVLFWMVLAHNHVRVANVEASPEAALLQNVTSQKLGLF